MGKNLVVPVIAVIVLIVAAVLIVRTITGSDVLAAGKGTWYDTGSGKIYGGPAGVLPPVPAPSGKDGVAAAVFSKGACKNSADRYIAYLYKYTEEGKKRMEAAQLEATDDARPDPDVEKIRAITREHRLVKREKDTEWVQLGTEEGAEIAKSQPKGTRLCPTYIE